MNDISVLMNNIQDLDIKIVGLKPWDNKQYLEQAVKHAEKSLDLHTEGKIEESRAYEKVSMAYYVIGVKK